LERYFPKQTSRYKDGLTAVAKGMYYFCEGRLFFLIFWMNIDWAMANLSKEKRKGRGGYMNPLWLEEALFMVFS